MNEECRGTCEATCEYAQGDFEPYPMFTADGSVCDGMPQPNAAGPPQQCPLQPLHFSIGRLPSTAEGREKLDLIEERLRAIEGIGDYPFADMEELCLVPNVVIPSKF